MGHTHRCQLAFKKKKKRVPVLSLASLNSVRIRQSGRAGIRGVTAAPLTKLIRKDVKYDWVDAYQKCFEELKDRLTSAPVLALPNGKDGFVIYSDASR